MLLIKLCLLFACYAVTCADSDSDSDESGGRHGKPYKKHHRTSSRTYNHPAYPFPQPMFNGPMYPVQAAGYGYLPPPNPYTHPIPAASYGHVFPGYNGYPYPGAPGAAGYPHPLGYPMQSGVPYSLQPVAGGYNPRPGKSSSTSIINQGSVSGNPPPESPKSESQATSSSTAIINQQQPAPIHTATTPVGYYPQPSSAASSSSSSTTSIFNQAAPINTVPVTLSTGTAGHQPATVLHPQQPTPGLYVPLREERPGEYIYVLTDPNANEIPLRNKNGLCYDSTICRS